MESIKRGVIGANGLMGRGILFSLLEAHALRGDDFHLFAIDVDTSRYRHTKEFLRKELKKSAERNINGLRALVQKREDLISNQEIIDHFIEASLDSVSFSNDVHLLKGVDLVFEAIVENQAEKVDLFKRLKGVIKEEGLILSNTSSIPIHILAELSNWTGHMVGYHFYNPPHVNKLVEIVIPPQAEKLRPLVKEIQLFLRNKAVESHDVAGFIGNGMFLREVAFACRLLEEYSLYAIDQATEKLLVRPMGIFKLVNFVGLNTVKAIASIMGIDIHPISEWKEISFEEEPLSLIAPSYKEALSDRALLTPHFKRLFSSDSSLDDLARRFLLESRVFAEQLVKRGVANSIKDVDTVLQEGFHHLYGTENSYY